MRHAAQIPRLATVADSQGCLDIYRPVVEHTATSFEVTAPSLEEFTDRLAVTLRTWPWLVAEDASGILGYAYASEHRRRAAYRWCVEVSAYVREEQRRTGLGRTLYQSLFAGLRAQGFYNAYAGIVIPNDSSIGFHRSLGFTEVGVYKNIGFKAGAWRSVSWWQRSLQPRPESTPPPPRPLAECRELVARAIADG